MYMYGFISAVIYHQFENGTHISEAVLEQYNIDGRNFDAVCQRVVDIDNALVQVLTRHGLISVARS